MCCEGTCARVVDAFDHFMQLPDADARRVFWLNGGAGTGKTVAAAQLVLRFVAQSPDMAVFWCKHDAVSLTDPLQLVKTIALPLACTSAAVAKSLFAIPDFVAQLQKLEDRGRENPTEMIERLLVNPVAYAKSEIEKKSSADAPILVVIDAVGACGWARDAFCKCRSSPACSHLFSVPPSFPSCWRAPLPPSPRQTSSMPRSPRPF